MGILHVPVTHVHVLLWGIYPAVRFLNHNCMFSFRRRHQLSKVVVPKYTPLPMSVTPHLRQHLVLLGFLILPTDDQGCLPEALLVPRKWQTPILSPWHREAIKSSAQCLSLRAAADKSPNVSTEKSRGILN